MLLWIYSQELRSTGVVGVVSIPVKKCFVTVVTIMLVTVNRKLCECLQTLFCQLAFHDVPFQALQVDRLS